MAPHQIQLITFMMSLVMVMSQATLHIGARTDAPACPVQPVNLYEHYRAALAYLQSEDVQQVIHLRDRDDCEDVRILRKLLWKQRLKVTVARSVEELERVVAKSGKKSKWAVLAQSADALSQVISKKLKDVYWYVPELISSSISQNVDGEKLKIVTSHIMPADWVTNDNVQNYLNKSVASNLINHRTEAQNDGVSVVLLRYVRPRPLEHSSHINVLRNSPWIILGTLRPDESTHQPAGAIFLLRSHLKQRLAEKAVSCSSGWTADVMARDPLTGLTVVRKMTESSMPSTLATQSDGPLKLTIHCPGIDVKCTITTIKDSCEGMVPENEVQNPRRHRRFAYDDWRPVIHHETTTVAAEPYSSRQERSQNYVSENAAQQYQSHHTSGTSHVSARSSDQNYYQPYHETSNYIQHRDRPTHPRQRSYNPHRRYYNNRNNFHNYNSHGYRRRFLPPANNYNRRLITTQSNKIAINTFPSFVTCGGAVTGCGICVVLLETLKSTTPTACIGPCSLGTSSACAGALATLWKEIITDRQAKEEKNKPKIYTY